MLLMGEELGCTEEILTIVSILSVPSVFFRPKERAEKSDAAREKFFVPESDHLTLLNVYQQWEKKSYDSVKESNTSMLEHKKREKEEKSAMEEEMEQLRRDQVEAELRSKEREKRKRGKQQQQQISGPGLKKGLTFRPKKFGL